MESFENLVEQYEPLIHKVMRSLHIYKNKDEFYQIGLITLWEAANQFQPEKGSFTNYVYTCMKGRFLSEMTKSNRFYNRFVSGDDAIWNVMEAPISRVPLEMNLLLSYCTSSDLSDKQTKWVIYTFIHQLTVLEIAELENVSVSAVKAWRSAATKKLKKYLSEHHLFES